LLAGTQATTPSICHVSMLAGKQVGMTTTQTVSKQVGMLSGWQAFLPADVQASHLA
jgi:hypothetical protein